MPLLEATRGSRIVAVSGWEMWLGFGRLRGSQVSISMRHFKVSLANHWVFFRRARRRIISTPHELPQSYTIQIFHICLPVIPSDFFSSDVFHAHCGSAAVPKQMDTDVCKLRVRSHAEPAFADSSFSLFLWGVPQSCPVGMGRRFQHSTYFPQPARSSKR